MPLKAATILAVHRGRVELTTEIIDGARDTPDALVSAIRARMADHQADVMSDWAILDPDSVAVASAFVSRDPLGQAHHEGLGQLGLSATETDGGGAREASLFARFGPKRRSQLDRWVIGYHRARDLSTRLGRFESQLVEGIEQDDDDPEDASDRVIAAASDALELELEADAEGLAALEELLLKDKANRQGRWVLHPACVKGLAAFVGGVICGLAPESAWSDDPDAPLHVRARGGVAVGTDPSGRVIDLVVKGRQARLSEYAEAVVRQSLTSGART